MSLLKPKPLKPKPQKSPASSLHASARKAAEKKTGRLRPALLAWFDKEARKLPWRKSPLAGDPLWPEKKHLRRNPYAAWIAEIMLQQTQVITVIPYFEKWLRQFPDAATLAKASEENVLRHWAGLGYYARARNLHRGAKMLSALGRYPSSLEGWRALPGIGPYTAGAIASLAFNLPEPILDGNVVRVLSRLFGLWFLPGEGRAQREAYWELAALWPEGSRSGDTNEALMELGALVCTPANPRCGACPVASGCEAKKHGWQNSLPPVKPRARVKAVAGVALVARHRGRILMEARAPGSFLAGHDLFPLFLEESVGEEEKEWTQHFKKRFPGFTLKEAPQDLGRVQHSIMSRRYVLRVMEGTLEVSQKVAGKNAAVKWVTEVNFAEALTNSLARKIWKQACRE